MKILVTDGYKKADFLFQQMCTKEHHITFIHDDIVFANKMISKYNIDVYVGNTSDPMTYEKFDDNSFDVLICLSNKDYKNYIICNIACKRLYVKKKITMISNPNNRQAFSKLGIEGTVSASHLITNIINKMATVDEAMDYISINNNEVYPLEIKIKSDARSINKKLMDINFPEGCIVCCIIRGKHSIIPNGSDHIELGDKIVIFTNIKDSNKIHKVLL